jgi:hypothetical protein
MNRLIPLLVISALLAISAYILTRKTEQIYSAEVNLSAIKAMTYFADSNKLSRWMIPFTNGATFKNDQLLRDNDTISILKFSAFNIDFRRSNPKGSLNFSISVVPDKDSVFQSYFLLSYSIPRWKHILGDDLAEDARTSLDSLQAYLGNPDKLYGFPLKMEPVADTSFLFARKTIAKKDFATETKALFDMLISEAEKRGAGYNGVRIFHFQDAGNQRTLFASVGIKKDLETKEGDIVSLKKMPYQMNLLTLDYKGTYKDITKAYQALEDYRSDYRYVTMAIPFHKYLQDGYGFDDSTVVHMKVCYPVF